jgi:hypothetical protein
MLRVVADPLLTPNGDRLASDWPFFVAMVCLDVSDDGDQPTAFGAEDGGPDFHSALFCAHLTARSRSSAAPQIGMTHVRDRCGLQYHVEFLGVFASLHGVRAWVWCHFGSGLMIVEAYFTQIYYYLLYWLHRLTCQVADSPSDTSE